MAPRDSRILGNLATLYQTQGQQREARTALLQADITPASPYFLMVRGDLEMTQGNFEGAIVLYRRARSLAPKLPDPLICIAQAEMARDRPRAARRALQRALVLDPGSEEARSLLGRLDGVAPPP
jgi:Flp pilus assembly protein TadD